MHSMRIQFVSVGGLIYYGLARRNAPLGHNRATGTRVVEITHIPPGTHERSVIHAWEQFVDAVGIDNIPRYRFAWPELGPGKRIKA